MKNNHPVSLVTGITFVVFAALAVLVEIRSEEHDKRTFISERLADYSDIFSRTDDYEATMRLMPEHLRLTVLGTAGDVIFDSSGAAGTMESHFERPEVKQALSGIDGWSVRESSTMHSEYLYFAREYGGSLIIRVALPYELDLKEFFRPDWIIVFTILMLFVLASLISLYFTDRYDKRRTAQSEERNRALKHEMTGNIAHELKTPVAGILGYLETLDAHPELEEERRRQYIGRAYHQTLRLSELIRDTAIVTKMEEAPEQFKREMLDVRAVADDVLQEFGPKIEEHGDKVENLIPAGLTLEGNYTLLFSIFHNMVENSLKYAGRGVTLHFEAKGREGALRRFVYWDTGSGVSTEDLDRIFERFYRTDIDRASGTDGSGLGLSIVRNAVRFHGGSITAMNRTDGGLRFDFFLRTEN